MSFCRCEAILWPRSLPENYCKWKLDREEIKGESQIPSTTKLLCRVMNALSRQHWFANNWSKHIVVCRYGLCSDYRLQEQLCWEHCRRGWLAANTDWPPRPAGCIRSPLASANEGVVGAKLTFLTPSLGVGTCNAQWRDVVLYSSLYFTFNWYLII